MTLTAKLLTEPSVSAAIGGLMGAFMGGVNTAAGTSKALYGYKTAPGSVSVNVGGYEIREGMSDAQVLELVRNGGLTDVPTDTQYVIKKDADGGYYVEIEEDILDGVPETKWDYTVRKKLKEKFPNGLRIGDRLIAINNKTRGEVTESDYKKILEENNTQMLYDRYNAINNLDEVWKVQKNVNIEDAKHERDDNIKKFARGFVDFSIGGRDYTGEMLTGITSTGREIMYDLVGIQSTNINKVEPTSAQPMNRNNDSARRKDTDVGQPYNNRIPYEKPVVKNQIQEALEKAGLNAFQNKVINESSEASFPANSRVAIKGRSEFASDEAYAHYLNGIAQSVFAKVPREMLNYAEAVAQNTGIKFVIGDTEYITGVESAGAYSWKDDMVLLDYDTLQSPKKFLLAVMNHEIVHPSETSMFYKRLEKYAFEQMFGGNEKALSEAIKKKQQRYAKSGVKLGEKGAKAELVASYIGESILTSEEAINRLVIEKPTLAMQIREALVKAYDKVKTYFTDRENYDAKYAISDLEKGIKLFEKALYTRRNFKDFVKRLSGDVSGDMQYALVGECSDGRKVYKSNYPPNTPKNIKQNDIIKIVQNAWSKKNIKLNIGGQSVEINFDPELSDRSDLAKIAFGNRKGTGSERRITLDLSSDLYMIAEDAKYTGSKQEIGKDNPTHKGVKRWLYFVTNLIYEGADGKRIPCYMNIDVKEKENGKFFYSFAIEKGTAPQTLLAAGDDNNRRQSSQTIYHKKNILSSENDFQNSTPVAEIQKDDEVYLTDEQDYNRRLYFLKSIDEFTKRMEDEGFPDYYIDKVYNQLNYAMMCAYEGDYSVFTDVLPGVDIKAVKKTVLTGDLTHIFGKKK